MHIPYNNSGIEGILGFRWMTSFLFAMALPLTQITSGLIIKYLSSYAEKEVKSYFNGLSNLVVTTGFFFLLWTLVPSNIKEGFKDEYYYVFVAITSMLLCYLSHHLHIAVINIEKRLKEKIKYLFKFIYSLNTNNYIKKEKEKEFSTKRIEVTDYIILGKDE